MLRMEFSGSVAVSVSPVVAPVKMRPKLATPPEIGADTGEFVRSEFASVTPMLTKLAVNAVPLSVRVTWGAGDMNVFGNVPVGGGPTVPLTGLKARA